MLNQDKVNNFIKQYINFRYNTKLQHALDAKIEELESRIEAAQNNQMDCKDLQKDLEELQTFKRTGVPNAVADKYLTED